jgi:hypothetical protein
MKIQNRKYQLRGREVQLQELEDLVAIRQDRTTQMHNQLVDSVEEIASDVVLPQVRAFEDAGWTFVPREQSADGARVYLKKTGRVALNTGRLTVRMAPALPADQAENFLSELGYKIVDRLKMAPNLFVVEVPTGHDPIDAADQLAKLNNVVFAEPELIEMLSNRGD